MKNECVEFWRPCKRCGGIEEQLGNLVDANRVIALVKSQAKEIERLTRERDEARNLVERSKIGVLALDVDNPLYAGLVLECLSPSVLANTVRSLKAQRDEARKAATTYRDHWLAASPRLTWVPVLDWEPEQKEE